MERIFIDLKEDDQDLINVTKLYGETHSIKALVSTDPEGFELSLLSDNESICYGNKGYVFLLTKKQ